MYSCAKAVLMGRTQTECSLVWNGTFICVHVIGWLLLGVFFMVMVTVTVLYSGTSAQGLCPATGSPVLYLFSDTSTRVELLSTGLEVLQTRDLGFYIAGGANVTSCKKMYVKIKKWI